MIGKERMGEGKTLFLKLFSAGFLVLLNVNFGIALGQNFDNPGIKILIDRQNYDILQCLILALGVIAIIVLIFLVKRFILNKFLKKRGKAK